MAEVSEHISEHANVVDVFHDINSVLSGFYQCIRSENVTLFTVTKINSMRKSNQSKNSEARWKLEVKKRFKTVQGSWKLMDYPCRPCKINKQNVVLWLNFILNVIL